MGEESVCHHWDEGLAEFVDELSKSRDQGCQTGESSLTFQASQGRAEAEPTQFTADALSVRTVVNSCNHSFMH